jgi:hypothetical protein
VDQNCRLAIALVGFGTFALHGAAAPGPAVPDSVDQREKAKMAAPVGRKESGLSRRGPDAADASVRVRVAEAQMTDAERFSLIVSVIGPAMGLSRDPRIPEHVTNTSAGYPPGHSTPGHSDAAEQRRQHGRHQPRLPARRQGGHGVSGVHRCGVKL